MADIIRTLDTLKRQAAQYVEDKQREIADLNNVMDQMQARERELNSEIENGTRMASEASDPTLLLQSGNYLMKAKNEIDEIAEAYADAMKIMDEKRDELSELFADEKRYDILLKRRLEERRLERLKKEQADLDEVGQTLHRRGIDEFN